MSSLPRSVDFIINYLAGVIGGQIFQGMFIQVYVGPSDCIVWAVDSRGSVYAREAVFPDYPIGTSWCLVPSVEASSLAIR